MFFISTYILLYHISSFFLTKTAVSGGEINEGIIGIPISFNPFFTTNEAERNVSAIIYGGLIKKTGPNSFIKELALDFLTSEDKKTHTFVLKEDIVFHDREPIDSKDFIFTINRKREIDKKFDSKWSDVVVDTPSVKKIIIKSTRALSKEEIVEFASVKIIPEHIWQKIPINLATSYAGRDLYVGSGPFLYKSVKTTQEGVIKEVILDSFDKYILGAPYLKNINFKFFQTKKELLKALQKNDVNSVVGVSPLDSTEILSLGEKKIISIPTNKIFGLFFNQGDGFLFSDSLLRSVFANIDIRDEIIENVLLGYATPIYEPDRLHTTELKDKKININFKDLNQTLDDFDWKISEGDFIREKNGEKLNITIAAPDIEEFQKILSITEESWRKIGASVLETKIPLHTDFSTYIKNNNNFDVLLWGYEVDSRRALEQIYNSKIDGSFVAILNYGNSDVNNLFDELKNTTDELEEKIVYNNIKEFLIRDYLAVFLYSPDVLYIIPKNIKGVERKELIFDLSDRFFNIHKWYQKEEEIWKTLIPQYN